MIRGPTRPPGTAGPVEWASIRSSRVRRPAGLRWGNPARRRGHGRPPDRRPIPAPRAVRRRRCRDRRRAIGARRRSRPGRDGRDRRRRDRVAEAVPDLADPSTSAPAPAAFVPGNVHLSFARIARGLSQPVFVTQPPADSSRTFVVEQGGRIRLIRKGVLQSTPFLDLRSKVSTGGERGLLGLAFHPDYSWNRKFYVNYTDRNGNTVIDAVPPLGDERQPGGADAQARHPDHPALREPQRRHARVRAGPLPLRRDGRRRQLRRPRQPRPERELAARQDPPDQRRHAEAPTRSRRRTRTSGRTATTSSGRSGCATRGASRSTRRPATSGSATSGRTATRRSTARRRPTRAAA